MKTVTLTFQISDEMAQNWEAFTAIVRAELLKSFADFNEQETERMFDELMNGTGNKEPVGFAPKKKKD